MNRGEMMNVKDLGYKYKTTEWLLDELERLVNLEHGLYLFELEQHSKHRDAIRNEIIKRTTR